MSYLPTKQYLRELLLSLNRCVMPHCGLCVSHCAHLWGQHAQRHHEEPSPAFPLMYKINAANNECQGCY